MGLLRNRNLAAVLTAELVSLTGSAMTYVALPWFVLTVWYLYRVIRGWLRLNDGKAAPG